MEKGGKILSLWGFVNPFLVLLVLFSLLFFE